MRNVNPKLQLWLAGLNEILRSLEAQNIAPTPTAAREGFALTTQTHVTDYPPVAYITDDNVEGTPVRIYHPSPEERLPVMIYFHGGGHMAGSIEVYEPICRKIAKATNHIVISVDYRLSPENPYPAGLNDAYKIVENIWALLEKNGVEPEKKLTIAGDSGGGALSASICHKAQYDDNIKIDNQILIYPSLDYTMREKSVKENSKGYLLEEKGMVWYFDNYFQHGENREKASPLYMEYSNALPRTFVITTEFCPLRDEGLKYVEKLQQAGVEASGFNYPDMIHGFLNLENLVREECDSLYRSLHHFLSNQ